MVITDAQGDGYINECRARSRYGSQLSATAHTNKSEIGFESANLCTHLSGVTPCGCMIYHSMFRSFSPGPPRVDVPPGPPNKIRTKSLVIYPHVSRELSQGI